MQKFESIESDQSHQALDYKSRRYIGNLRYLDAPKCVIEKAPSAALFDGQTDETEMGVTYAELDAYLSGSGISEEKKTIIERLHNASEHKRKGIAVYKND